MGYLQIIENLTKNAWKVSNLLVQKKPPGLKSCAQENRTRFQDEATCGNFEKFAKDARVGPPNLVQKNWLCISWESDSPRSRQPPEEIARKPLPFKPSGNGFAAKAREVGKTVRSWSPWQSPRMISRKAVVGTIVLIKRQTLLVIKTITSKHFVSERPALLFVNKVRCWKSDSHCESLLYIWASDSKKKMQDSKDRWNGKGIYHVIFLLWCYNIKYKIGCQ